MSEALPSQLVPLDYSHSPLLSFLEDVALESDPSSRGKLQEAYAWLENYTRYSIHEDNNKWWMQNPLNIATELRHWNSWKSWEQSQSQAEGEMPFDFEELDLSTIIPVSLLRLRALYHTEGVDSKLYPIFLIIHESLREAALRALETNKNLRFPAHGEEIPIPPPFLASPAWELLHKPQREIDHDSRREVIAFAQPDDRGVFGFAARNLIDPDLQGGDEGIIQNYFFRSQNQAGAVYETLQNKIGYSLSPLYEIPPSESFPEISLEAEQNPDLTPLLSPWYHPDARAYGF